MAKYRASSVGRGTPTATWGWLLSTKVWVAADRHGERVGRVRGPSEVQDRGGRAGRGVEVGHHVQLVWDRLAWWDHHQPLLHRGPAGEGFLDGGYDPGAHQEVGRRVVRQAAHEHRQEQRA